MRAVTIIQRLAVEASPTAMIMVNASGQIELTNTHTERLFGYSSLELIGRPMEMLLPERVRGSHPAHRAAFLGAAMARPMGAGRALFARRKDGTEFQVEIGLNPIHTGEGLLVLAAIVDVTARRQVEQEADAHRRELARVARVATLGELSASLAHELNQPLTAILSNAQAGERLLASDPPDLQELREILKDIAHDTATAGQVIRQMRSLARKETLDFSSLDLEAVLDGVVRLTHGDATLRSCRVVLLCPADLPRVRGDRVQLQQVAVNLLLNAFEAMKECPAAERQALIQAQPEGDDRVKVAVRDRGLGLAEAELERIFEPFYTTKHEGLGMGLSISRSIVAAHGGRLWPEINPDRGTTFYFTVPTA